MILKSLYMNNIRSYTELELDFKNGTSLFEGNIGSGKSTILMAVEFALFGLGGIKGNSLLRAGEKEGVVRLNFSANGENYEVQRKLVRARKKVNQAKDGCYIKDSQGILPMAPSDLKPKILDILNFNEPSNPRAKSVIFTYAIFTPQEEMKTIITDKPDQRLQTLRKAFRIEDYKIAANNAYTLYKEIDRKSEYLSGAASGLDEDNDRKTELENSLTEEKKTINPLEQSEKKENKLREKIQKDLEKKRKVSQDLTTTAGQIPVIEKQIQSNEKEIGRLEKAVEKERKEAKKVVSEMDQLSDIKKPTPSTYEDIELEIKSIEKEENKLRKNEGAVSSKIQEYESVEKNGTCPTCDRPADPKEFKEKIKVKESEREIIEIELQDLEKRKKEANELLKELRKYEKAQSDLTGLKERFDGCQARIKESIGLIKELSAKIKEAKAFVKKAKKQHEKLETVNKEIEELTRQDKEKEKKIRQLASELAALKERVAKTKEQIGELNETIKTKKQQLELSKKLGEYVVWIRDYFIPTVETIEKSVLATINDEFNEKFREWFSILVEDNTKDARIDEDFTPIVEQDGYEMEILFLSGGEKTSIALSYRLALNNLVQKVSTGMKSNLLILDEPTDGFSKEQLYKVRDILNELKCPQVILVSHERELESFADHIYRIVKTNGVSEVTT